MLSNVEVRVNGFGADLPGQFGRLTRAYSYDGGGPMRYVNFVGFVPVIIDRPPSFFPEFAGPRVVFVGSVGIAV
jgi:hypothetical protein